MCINKVDAPLPHILGLQSISRDVAHNASHPRRLDPTMELMKYSFVLYLQYGRHDVKCKPSIALDMSLICNVYKMSAHSVSVYTDTSTSRKYLCTLIQNGLEFCRLFVKRPQAVMF